MACAVADGAIQETWLVAVRRLRAFIGGPFNNGLRDRRERAAINCDRFAESGRSQSSTEDGAG
jgi:hypothetical protein